jgi:tellurite resistance protein TehA-like permease
MNYSPPVTDPTLELVKEVVQPANLTTSNATVPCILQAKNPAPRQLSNLAPLPILILTSEASYLVDDHPSNALTVDTEQHKKRHGHHLRKRSIRHYRHATTKWGAALESFNPMWFAIAISTGGLATILNGPFPYPAVWQVTLASILYVFEIVLFVVFSALMIARWVMYPHVAVRRALADPDELGAYAIPPIALMTIAALMASQVSKAEWGGHAFTLVAYVLWWIGVTWVFVTALVVLTVFIYTGNQMDRNMTPVLFMAPVGLATAGVEAGFITIYSAEVSTRLAVPMVIVGYFAIGVAFFMAIILYTVYFHRLLAAGWSAPASRAAIFILASSLSIDVHRSVWLTGNVDRSRRPTLDRLPTSRGVHFDVPPLIAV